MLAQSVVFHRWPRGPVRDLPRTSARAYGELAAGGAVLAQQPAAGTYAQVAGLFAHGRLAAVHTSELAGIGAGGSAAARVSVDHPQPRAHIEKLGAHLGWHGGLTLDYLHQHGTPQYIEANARTVEPGKPHSQRRLIGAALRRLVGSVRNPSCAGMAGIGVARAGGAVPPGRQRVGSALAAA